jgi:hypothetical protein
MDAAGSSSTTQRGGGASERRDGAPEPRGGASESQRDGSADRDNIVIKCAIVGDTGEGKTSLLVRYVERRFDSSYCETLVRVCEEEGRGL